MICSEAKDHAQSRDLVFDFEELCAPFNSVIPSEA
jgi:hypothetical protein